MLYEVITPLAGVEFWDISKYPQTITTNADGRFVSQGYSAGDYVWFNTYGAGVTLSYNFV